MKTAYLLSGALTFAAITIAAPTVEAQSHDLYFAQVGAALTYSYAEVRVLYGAVHSGKYDPKLTADTLEEIRRSLSSAKRQADRGMNHLPRTLRKFGPQVDKLRKAIARCQQTLSKVETDILEQTRPAADDELTRELGRPLVDNDRSAPRRSDRKVMRNSVGWLAYDIKAARALYKEAAVKVIRRGLRSPRRHGRRPK